jgi:20S proteasome alpha/beta subunit
VTQILALRHAGGVVLASDSQATFETAGQPTRDDLQKLAVLGGNIGWGASGETGLISRIQAQLEAAMPVISREFRNNGEIAGGTRIQAIVNPMLQQARAEYVQTTGKQMATTDGLFVGFARQRPFIYAVERSGAHGPITPPYAAIGSGDVFAMHAMRSVAHFRIAEMTQTQALVLAYRTIENSISAAAFGVGGAIQLLAVTPDRAWCLDAGEVAAAQDVVGIWKTREVEVFGALAVPLTGRAAAEPAAAAEAVAGASAEGAPEPTREPPREA